MNVSRIACASGSTKVYVTDADEELLRTLTSTNFERNLTTAERDRVELRRLVWGNR